MGTDIFENWWIIFFKLVIEVEKREYCIESEGYT